MTDPKLDKEPEPDARRAWSDHLEGDGAKGRPVEEPLENNARISPELDPIM